MKSSENNSPRLVVIEGKDKGKIFPLKDGTMTIGRSKADITIHDPRISRSHVSIEYHAKTGKLYFTDLKSLNGTVINESLVEKGELKDGDKLQLGNTVFDCQIGTIEATVLATPPKKKTDAVAKETKAEKAEQDNDFKGTPSIQQRVEPALNFDVPPKTEPTREDGKKTKLKFFPQFPQKEIPKNLRIALLVVLVVSIWILLKPQGSSTALEAATEIPRIQALQKEGKNDEAYKAAEALAHQHPEDALSQYFYAEVAYSQNKLEEAINTLRKAHTLKGITPLVHVRLAKAYFRGGLSNEATDELKHIDEQLKGESAKNKDFVIQTGILLTEMRVNPEKIIALARSLETELAKDNTIGYKLEAGVLLELKRTEEAIGVLERGLLLDAKDEMLLEKLSFAKLTIKDLPGALKTLDTWIRTNPMATKPLLVLAYLKFNEKEYLAALPYLRNVTQILGENKQDPDFAEALHLTGKIYLEQNQKTEASQMFQKACGLGFQESCTVLQSLSAIPESKTNTPASIKESIPAHATAPAKEVTAPEAPAPAQDQAQ